MRKHWAKYLPEAGQRIKRRGDDFEYKLACIERLEAQLKQAKKEFREDEKVFENWLLTDWTKEEIAQAKQDAKDIPF